jgi:hypothetical protein
MITSVCQRWGGGRASYRPAGEVFDPASHEVAPLVGVGADNVASAFVERHHYSGTYPAARERVALYERGSGELVGVAVFSQPVSDASLSCLPGEREAKVCLGRFVLLNRVRSNGETWFLARCFEHLRREGYVGVVSFSDPFPRVRTDGRGERVVHVGHVGTIYQAHNAVYLGQAHADTIHLLPDGRTLDRRSIVKLRKRERGWWPVAKRLELLGAPALDDSPDWVERALSSTTRKIRHPGNFKYAWPLERAAKKTLSSHLFAQGLAPTWHPIGPFHRDFPKEVSA